MAKLTLDGTSTWFDRLTNHRSVSSHPLKSKAPVAERSRGHLVIFNYWQDSVYP